MATFHQTTPSLGQQTATMSPLYQRRGVSDHGHSIELLPNPDFVFPAQSAESSPSLDNWNALNRRSQPSPQPSASKPPSAGGRGHRSRGSVALPDFSFNPAAEAAPSAKSPVTPPLSPTNLHSPTTPSSRAMGHRRGGSEFIGGDGKGGAGLMSTSPVKGDAVLPAPPSTGRLGPPAGRGHRHRRSGAISCHDLQMIMQPKESSARGGSAPATPLDADQKPFFAPGQQRRAASQADIRTSPEQTRSASEGSPPRVVPRVRVGFSDRVEYIRPLSTISSETEGSLSTIRGHSVSNSLSSVISLSAQSPQSARIARMPLNTTYEDEASKTRPQSSGDVLDSVTKEKQDFHIQWQAEDRPKSAVSTPASEEPPALPQAQAQPKSPKRKSFTWWDSKKPTHVLRSSISEPSLLPSPPTSPDSVESPQFGSMAGELEPSDGEKQSKSKKAKSWTRSLISRKSKSHSSLKGKTLQDRPPTPPPPKTTSSVETEESLPEEPLSEVLSDEPLEFEPNFDVDETVTIVTDESQANLSVTPFRPRIHADSDPMSPVIDLDAALGPFKTPQFGANTHGSPSKPRQRRSLHSLGYQAAMNHQRTLSAPELAPFDMRNAKVAPAVTMPDVFEEEGEEEAERAEAERRASMDEEAQAAQVGAVALGISDLSLEPEDEPTPTQRSVLHQENATPLPKFPLDTLSTRSLTPLGSQRPSSTVDVVEDYEEPRASSFTRDSDSTITPPLTADDEKAPRPVMNLELPLPPHSVMTPDTMTSPSFSSRQFSNGSQVSLNAPRLGTASSTTDNRSLSFGEPGPAVRMSVDDVPSLSSSRSTMTTPPQRPFMFTDPYDRQGRAPSVTSIASLDEHRRRSKRASVASLSRLVGVKSKLSIETRPQSQHIMPTTPLPGKTKKSNRLSKLMQFWKKQPGDSRRGSYA